MKKVTRKMLNEFYLVLDQIAEEFITKYSSDYDFAIDEFSLKLGFLAGFLSVKPTIYQEVITKRKFTIHQESFDIGDNIGAKRKKELEEKRKKGA